MTSGKKRRTSSPAFVLLDERFQAVDPQYIVAPEVLSELLVRAVGEEQPDSL